MPAASDKQVRKIPSSTRLRAMPIAEGEEARGLVREATLQHSPVVLESSFTAPPRLRPSTSFPACGFISSPLPACAAGHSLAPGSETDGESQNPCPEASDPLQNLARWVDAAPWAGSHCWLSVASPNGDLMT